MSWIQAPSKWKMSLQETWALNQFHVRKNEKSFDICQMYQS